MKGKWKKSNRREGRKEKGREKRRQDNKCRRGKTGEESREKIKEI